MAGMDWARAKKRALYARRRRSAFSRPMSLAEVPVGASGYRGVYFQRDKNKFRAAIEVEGQRHHLGYFAVGADAARVYDQAAREAWGAAAVTNFPSEARP